MPRVVDLYKYKITKAFDNPVNQRVFNTPCEFYNHTNDPDCL